MYTYPRRVLRSAGEEALRYTHITCDRLRAWVGSTAVALVLETYRQVPWLAIIAGKAMGHEKDAACRVEWRPKVHVLVAATNRGVVGSRSNKSRRHIGITRCYKRADCVRISFKGQEKAVKANAVAKVGGLADYLLSMVGREPVQFASAVELPPAWRGPNSCTCWTCQVE